MDGSLKTHCIVVRLQWIYSCCSDLHSKKGIGWYNRLCLWKIQSYVFSCILLACRLSCLALKFVIAFGRCSPKGLQSKLQKTCRKEDVSGGRAPVTQLFGLSY